MRRILTAAAVALAMSAAALAQGAVYKAGKDGVTNPQLTREVHPTYTKSAMERKVQGSMEVVAIVKTDGTVAEDVRVTKSLDDELDQQGIIAVRQWTFKPGTKDGHPVDVEVNIELTFKLK